MLAETHCKIGSATEAKCVAIGLVLLSATPSYGATEPLMGGRSDDVSAFCLLCLSALMYTYLCMYIQCLLVDSSKYVK